jgi:hypothetical protein
MYSSAAPLYRSLAASLATLSLSPNSINRNRSKD